MKADYTFDRRSVNFYLPLNAGLRLLTAYDVGSDQLITRIDVKFENRQYAAAFCSGTPKAVDHRLPDSDMFTPNKGIDTSCFNIKANKEEIIRALRELANDLENDTADLPLNGH